MTKKQILDQIHEAGLLINKLDEIMISIAVDVKDLQSHIDIKDLKEAMVYIARREEWDINKSSYITYTEDLEKRKLFFHGIEQGYCHAIFWICVHFGLKDFFEEKIGHRFSQIDFDDC